MMNDASGTVKTLIDRGRPLLDAVISEVAKDAAALREHDLHAFHRSDSERKGSRESPGLLQLRQIVDHLVRSHEDQPKSRTRYLANVPVARIFVTPEPQGNRFVQPIRDAGSQAKKTAGHGANKGTELVAAAGWAIGTGVVVYRFVMDDRRRNATKRFATTARAQVQSIINDMREPRY